MPDSVQRHYQNYPYPDYPLIASVRRCDTYALNLEALWARFNRSLPSPDVKKILIAGCGTFAPYPWAVANPDVPITALDLSELSLKRARWHCLLHFRRNVLFRCGDLLDVEPAGDGFGLIDAYGVLHHLDDPVAGLKSLSRRLVTGGIVRVMFYSRYARREEDAIRRAFRLMGVRTPTAARKIMGRARPGSRLARYIASSDEAVTDSGIADALLHPCVRAYRIDELLEMIRQAGLIPLLFAHSGACENVEEEIIRLRALEKEYRSPGNFVLYLAAHPSKQLSDDGSNLIKLNPCLASVVGNFMPGRVNLPDRIGCGATSLGFRERRFLRRFSRPAYRGGLSDETLEAVNVYKRRLLLLEYSS
jgi:SAM-dependent methyltransferase